MRRYTSPITPKSVYMEAESIGDWRNMRRRMGLINQTVPHMGIIIRQEAERSRDRLKGNILSQKYNWEPLSRRTLDNKRSAGTDMRTLIEHMDYVKAIRVVPLGPNMWAVGILKTDKDPHRSTGGEERTLAQIGLMHEYGTSMMPARPHWRIEYQQFYDDLRERLTAALTAATRGKRPVRSSR